MRRSSRRLLAAPPRARVVVVLGASSGIGRAAAHRFAAQGDHLVLVARGAAALADTRGECETRGASSVTVVTLDVRDDADVRQLVARTLDEHGRIDVVLHAAALMAYGRVEDVPADVFDRVVDTVLHGTVNIARAVLPVFRRQRAGTLIAVNSLLGYITAPGMGAYVTAKWGQLGLLRLLQVETRDAPGVHVCVVAPGAVDTPIYRVAANYLGRSALPPPPVDPADKVARRILACAKHPRRRTSVGAGNPLIIAGFRLAPRLFDLLVAPLMSRLALADDEQPVRAGNVFAPEPGDHAVSGRWTTGLIRPLRDRLHTPASPVRSAAKLRAVR